MTAGGMVALGLDVDLGNQGAGGVEEEQIAGPGSFGHRFGHAMGRKDHGSVIGTFVEFAHEHCPERLEPFDHMAVMDDLVTDIDRGPIFLEGAFDDLDSAVDPGAEASRRGQTNGHGTRFAVGDGRGDRHGRNLVVHRSRRYCR